MAGKKTAELASLDSAVENYWPDEDAFATKEECGEFYNALAVLEGLGETGPLIRFLKRGTPISPGVAKTLAYILGGGKLQSSSPKGTPRNVITVPHDTPRDFFPDLVLTPEGIKFVNLPAGSQVETIPHNKLRGPFYVTVKERPPMGRPADRIKKSTRYQAAAEELRERVKAGEPKTKALEAVRAKHGGSPNKILAYYENLDSEFDM
jgi:hypothetical protein